MDKGIKTKTQRERIVNGRWALARVVELLANAMEDSEHLYDNDDHAALDVVGKIVFRIEPDEEFLCTNPWAFKEEESEETAEPVGEMVDHHLTNALQNAHASAKMQLGLSNQSTKSE